MNDSIENLVKMSSLFYKLAKKKDKTPEGWTQKSFKRYMKEFDGSVGKCIKELKNKVEDSGAFCASMQDKAKGKKDWRSKD